MKTLKFIFLLVLFAGKTVIAQQYPELANFPETKTGIYGSILHSTSKSEVFDKKDFSSTYGFLQNGSTFELLSTLAVKHPKYSSLNMVLIKVTSDPENKNVGRVGWVHVKSTTLNARFNSSTMRIDGETSAKTNTSSFASTPELNTGIYGSIDNDTGKEVFDMKDFSPPTTGSGFLKNGATFDLLNTQTVIHPDFALDMILVRITYDPDGSYTGKVGWVNVNATSLKNKFNSVTKKIENSKTGSTSSSSANSQFANYKEENTGIYGSIAHATADSEVFDKKDFSSTAYGFLKNGATFDLLSKNVVKHPTYSLNMVLIKVTFDPENKYTGKVGWVHVEATSIKNRLNSTSMKIE